MKRCPNCKKSKLANKKVEVTETVAGHVFRAVARAEVCGECDETFYAPGAIDRLHLLVANELALAGLDAGDAIRYMRKAAGVAAGDLARLLDVRPETVSRWENSKKPIDRGDYATLHQLVLDRLQGTTATRDYLERLDAPRRLPRVVTLDDAIRGA